MDTMILTGAGQIGMAIARRIGAGMKIVIGDKKVENAENIARIMKDAGFDTVAMEMDLWDGCSSVGSWKSDCSRRGRGNHFQPIRTPDACTDPRRR